MPLSTVAGSRAPERNQLELLRELAVRRAEFIAFARGRLGPGVDSEDLVQQALLRATQKIGLLRDPSLVVPWFYRVLRRAIADHHARAKSEHLRWQSAQEPGTVGTAATCACSLTVLASLPERYAEVLRRVDLGDESLAEVAGSLGTTVNNTTLRLHRARKALRERLRESCGTTSARACLDCAC
jgi:DNA-directed RNA polymerase specialized sigma24 family protein